MTDNIPVASSEDARPETDVRVEHSFAEAKDGIMVDPPADGQSIRDYIFMMGRSGGFEYCGYYPTASGLMIVMKRYRRD